MENQQQQRQEYLVKGQVIKVRVYKGGNKTGASYPIARISVSNLAPLVTTTERLSNTAVFNKSFPFLLVNSIEFESFEIKIKLSNLSISSYRQLSLIYQKILSNFQIKELGKNKAIFQLLQYLEKDQLKNGLQFYSIWSEEQKIKDPKIIIQVPNLFNFVQ